ncbi:MAG: hypothetical protein ACRDHP_00025, partial [Ktedonobacterales bacterium]
MDHGDEQNSDMTTRRDTWDEAVVEADTAELKAVNAPPAPTGDAPALADAGPTDADAAAEDAPNGTPPASPGEAQPVRGDVSPLAPGASVGSYRVERVLHASADEVTYLARETPPDESAPSTDGVPPASAAHVVLIERRPGNFAAATGIVALRLRHPRLLAPRELIEREGYEYLVLEALAGPDGALAETVAQGARLDPPVALAAGAGLADALSYLHRNSVAHPHVSPDVLVVSGGRVYLGGMEGAERVAQGTGDLTALFARDANFLARSLGILAGIPDEPRIAGRAVDLFLHVENPFATVGGTLCRRLLLQHHRAEKILLRQQELVLAVAVHIRR